MKVIREDSKGGAWVNPVNKDANLLAHFRHPVASHCSESHEKGSTASLRWEDEEGGGESGDSPPSNGARMTCFYKNRGEHRDLEAKSVVISGVESEDLRFPSVQENDTDSGVSHLEYGSRVFDTKSGFSSSSNTSGALPAVLARRAPEVYEDVERTNRDALGCLQLCNAFL